MQLSDRAGEIFDNVCDAMQAAEEINGVEGVQYVLLMKMIADHATLSMFNCAVININEVTK